MNVWYLEKHKITYLFQMFLLILIIIFSFIPIISSTSISTDGVVTIGKYIRIIQLGSLLVEGNPRSLFSFIILSLLLFLIMVSIILLFFNIQKASYVTILLSSLFFLIDYFSSNDGLFVFQIIASFTIMVIEIALIVFDRRVYPYVRKR